MKNLVSIRTCQQLLAATLSVAILSLVSCAKNKGGGGDPYYDPNNPHGGGGDPYANPFGGGSSQDIPLSGRPEGGVNFYGANVNRELFPPVYFAFDRYDVSGAEYQKIQQVAQYLRSNPSNLIIAGHTDEVGTSEYNRNLGDRRATAIRAALAQSGVDPGRVHTVSYGEDMPTQGGDAANRRGEFGFYR